MVWGVCWWVWIAWCVRRSPYARLTDHSTRTLHNSPHNQDRISTRANRCSGERVSCCSRVCVVVSVCVKRIDRMRERKKRNTSKWNLRAYQGPYTNPNVLEVKFEQLKAH